MKRMLLVIGVVMVLLSGCEPPPPEWSQYYVAEQDILDVIETDRLLLIELSRDIPTSREEGLRWWEEVTKLAIASDPKLSDEASSVGRLLELFYDFINTFQDTERSDVERYAAYLSARETSSYLTEAMREFADAAIFSIIKHMDSVQYVVEPRE